MTLGSTLYLRGSVAAADFYSEAFGMTIGYHVKNDGGGYLHAELEKEGGCVFAVSESDDAAARDAMLGARQPTVSLGLNLPDEAALRHAFGRLAEGGHVLRPLGALPWSPLSADVVDRYGVCWYIYVSQHRPD